MPTITYLPDNREVVAQPDDTILQTSLNHEIPHTHVCGGEARCTTCRVLVLEGLQNCSSPRNEKEQLLANRLHFDPTIRLACQTRIWGDVKVRRLVLDDQDIALVDQTRRDAVVGFVGEEKQLTILFADIRNFTAFAEKQLPYDVIHLLNRYFHLMGSVIEKHNGRIDNYMGDGLLAIFESDSPGAAALNGVKAGLEMVAAMTGMQPYLVQNYGQTLQIGIGIHCGVVISGAVGGAERKNEMIIGDAVNFASRIEEANKQSDTHLLISEAVYQEVKRVISCRQSLEVTVKGKQGQHHLFEVTGLLPE
ncbi:MAG: adenylate/guanylate cyclase domain-containing protein [Chloroflexi bacterium]|nr:adenylate/guanylate cyclase domain-containing protein [Chloroflexota bacterium]